MHQPGLVHEAGIEPAGPVGHQGLSLTRLPIPPLVHMVIPAGFEPSISALKGRRPIHLVEGTMPALFPELGLFYAVTRNWTC